MVGPNPICRAIQTRSLLAFDYGGHHRIVEPYCHGRGAGGREFLAGYQVSGGTDSERLGWRLFAVARITQLRVVNDSFQVRTGFFPSEVAIDVMHCRI